MRITSKGQVTIPQAIRDRYGLFPDTEVDFVERDGVVVVQLAEARRHDRADRAIRSLRGSGSRKFTTDELLAMTTEQ